MTARDFIRLLAARHSKDIFVSECKDGASVSRGSFLRLDAWAAKRSYAHPLYTGYEIKCSRSDFTHDVKWRNYLPLCNELYFVCPTGLIEKTELPEEAGLLWASVNGARLYMKKKAPTRKVDEPIGLFHYILYSRATISTRDIMDNNADYWREWLEKKEQTEMIGRSSSAKIRRLIAEKISAVEKRNKELEERMLTYEQVKHALTDLGLMDDTGYRWDLTNRARNKAQELLKGIDGELLRSIQYAKNQLNDLLLKIEKHKNQTGSSSSSGSAEAISS